MDGLGWQTIFKAILQEVSKLGLDAEVEVILGDKNTVVAVRVKIHGKVEGND